MIKRKGGKGCPSRVPPRRVPQFRGEAVAEATGAVRSAASEAVFPRGALRGAVVGNTRDSKAARTPPQVPTRGAPRGSVGRTTGAARLARCFLKKPRAERFRQKKCVGAAPPPASGAVCGRHRSARVARRFCRIRGQKEAPGLARIRASPGTLMRRPGYRPMRLSPGRRRRTRFSFPHHTHKRLPRGSKARDSVVKINELFCGSYNPVFCGKPCGKPRLPVENSCQSLCDIPILLDADWLFLVFVSCGKR